jgi:hypothetical protein
MYTNKEGQPSGKMQQKNKSIQSNKTSEQNRRSLYLSGLGKPNNCLIPSPSSLLLTYYFSIKKYIEEI